MQKLLVKNRKASHDYELLERFEAGVALYGHEVKSLKEGGGNFVGSFVSIENNEAFIKKFDIKIYSKATLESYEPTRPRKLLLRKAEIEKITGALNTKGVTVVPLACGLKSGKIKIEIALARGKKKYDKRNDLKKKDQQRSIDRALARD